MVSSARPSSRWSFPGGRRDGRNLFLVGKASRIVSRRDRRDLPSSHAAGDDGRVRRLRRRIQEPRRDLSVWKIPRPYGAPEGASYLYFVDDKPKAQAFEGYLAAHPGAIDLWLGGHTHTHPDDVLNGRSHVERKWGVNFVNCAQLSKFHSYVTCPPMSRHFTFTEGSRLVRVRCYLNDDTHAAQGWYPNAERVLELSKPFYRS
jgi:hypothetical protein